MLSCVGVLSRIYRSVFTGSHNPMLQQSLETEAYLDISTWSLGGT